MVLLCYNKICKNNKGRDFMFKILKKDRSKILWLFFLEALIGVALLASLIVLERFFGEMKFIQDYSIYVVLGYFVLVNFINIKIFKQIIYFSFK